MRIYAADFESTTKENDCRVWAWGVANIDTESFSSGNTIESFFKHVERYPGRYYFHNLKFDGQFLLYYLLTNGYRHVTSREVPVNSFSTLISDMGQFYTITVRFGDTESGIKRVVEFVDSLKIIPMPVKAMPKAFGLDIYKLEIDYDEEREEDHELTEQERDYLKNDVLIVARSLQKMHDMGMTKLTVGSNALNNFMGDYTKTEKKYLFPKISLSEDRDIRLAYKGGFTYLNPKYKELKLNEGQVYDVNSMYPWAMKYCLLPYGEGAFYEGEYVEDEIFTLYVQCLKCEFELKKDMIPTIQIKNSMFYNETEYLKKSERPEILHLTSVDLQLFKEHYNIYNVEYICGYKYRGRKGMFSEYIDRWYKVKTESKESGNMSMYTIAKLMLNSLYGKFGTNPKKRSKYPWYDKENDIVRYSLQAEEIGKGGYIPIAAFITAYARDKIIRAAQACGDNFVYADTDSIHIIGNETPDIDIDDYRLGAFKLESNFTTAKFLRQKCYIETINGELNKKCAGMPDIVKENLDYDTLEKGHSFTGKLVPKIVKGGVVLKSTDFTIK